MTTIFVLGALALAVLAVSSVEGFPIRYLGDYDRYGGQGYVGQGRDYYDGDYYDQGRGRDYYGQGPGQSYYDGYYDQGVPLGYQYGGQSRGNYGQGYDGGRGYYGNQGYNGGQRYYPSYNRDTYNRPSFNRPTYNIDNYNRPSYNRPSYNRPTYDNVPTYNDRPSYSDAPIYDNRPSYDVALPAHQSLIKNEDAQDVVINLKGFREKIGDSTYDPNGIDRTLKSTRRGLTNFDIDDKRQNKKLAQVEDNDYEGNSLKSTKSDIGSRLRQQGKVGYDFNDLDAITNYGSDRQKESRGHQASDVAKDDQRYANKDYLQRSDGIDGDYYADKSTKDISRNRDRSRNVKDFVNVDNSFNNGQDTDKHSKKKTATQYQGDKQASIDNLDDTTSDGYSGRSDSYKRDNRISRNIDDNRATNDDLNEDSQRNYGEDIHKLSSSKRAQQNQGDDAFYSRQQGASNTDLVGEEPSSTHYDNLASSSKVRDQKFAKNALDIDDSNDFGLTHFKKSSGDTGKEDAGNTKTYKFIVNGKKGQPIDTNEIITQALAKAIPAQYNA